MGKQNVAEHCNLITENNYTKYNSFLKTFMNQWRVKKKKVLADSTDFTNVPLSKSFRKHANTSTTLNKYCFLVDCTTAIKRESF